MRGERREQSCAHTIKECSTLYGAVVILTGVLQAQQYFKKLVR